MGQVPAARACKLQHRILHTLGQLCSDNQKHKEAADFGGTMAEEVRPAEDIKTLPTTYPHVTHSIAMSGYRHHLLQVRTMKELWPPEDIGVILHGLPEFIEVGQVAAKQGREKS